MYNVDLSTDFESAAAALEISSVRGGTAITSKHERIAAFDVLLRLLLPRPGGRPAVFASRCGGEWS